MTPRGPYLLHPVLAIIQGTKRGLMMANSDGIRYGKYKIGVRLCNQKIVKISKHVSFMFQRCRNENRTNNHIYHSCFGSLVCEINGSHGF